MTPLSIDGASPDPQLMARAIAILQAGQLLIYPTDTLYALGGRAFDRGVAGRVREAKGREAGKPLPLVAADAAQAMALCAAWPAAATRLAAAFWPGPLTLVLPARAEVPAEVTAGGAGVALRVPALELTRALCRGAGPLISTSANRAGEKAPLTAAEAVAAVGEAVALALDAGPGRPVASTIVDLTGPEPRLVREGAVAWSDVLGVFPGRPR